LSERFWRPALHNVYVSIRQTETARAASGAACGWGDENLAFPQIIVHPSFVAPSACDVPPTRTLPHKGGGDCQGFAGSDESTGRRNKNTRRRPGQFARSKPTFHLPSLWSVSVGSERSPSASLRLSQEPGTSDQEPRGAAQHEKMNLRFVSGQLSVATEGGREAARHEELVKRTQRRRGGRKSQMILENKVKSETRRAAALDKERRHPAGPGGRAVMAARCSAEPVWSTAGGPPVRAGLASSPGSGPVRPRRSGCGPGRCILA
jgi:hypothetical protein